MAEEFFTWIESKNVNLCAYFSQPIFYRDLSLFWKN